MGMDTKLSDYTKTMIKPLILLLIVLTKEVGRFREKQNITLDKVKSIVEMSY
jgi:NADP-dependent alcohol dehydrogenase